MGPNPTPGGLVEVPVGSLHGFDGEFDARSIVPHVNIKHWEWRPWVLTMAAFNAFRRSFLDLDASKSLAPLISSVMKQSALREPDVLNVPSFPWPRCAGGYGR